MKMKNGVVTDIAENGWASVAISRLESCKDCGETHCCGSLGPGQTMIIKARNSIMAKKGDLVQLDYTTGAALKGASVHYVLILAGTVLGALLGVQLGQKIGLGGANAAILFSILAALLGLVVAALLHKRGSGSATHAPIIHRVIMRGLGNECGRNDKCRPIQTTNGAQNCSCGV